MSGSAPAGLDVGSARSPPVADLVRAGVEGDLVRVTLGAEGVGAEGVGAEGVGAEGVGAEGVGA
ncbi:MAG: hypothetical protein QOC67_487, partial [Pseudonocardiales bacterium]|nr:hypothetical protein [Pseudonocardiales bacterium]